MRTSYFHSAVTAALLSLLCAGSSGAAEAAADRSVYPGFPKFLFGYYKLTNPGAAVDPPQELSEYLRILEAGNPEPLLAYGSERPSSAFADDVLLEAARLLLSRDDHKAGEELLACVWALHHDGVRLDQKHRVFEGRGKVSPEQIERYESYIEHIGRYPNLTSDLAMVELGQLLVRLGRLDGASQILRRVIERYPEGQYSSEDTEEAVVVCYDPQRPIGDALWWLAEVARLRGDEGDYCRHLLRIVDLCPGSVRGLQALDALCSHWGKYDVAGRGKALPTRRLEVLEGLAEAAERKGFRARAGEYRLKIDWVRGGGRAEYSERTILDSDPRASRKESRPSRERPEQRRKAEELGPPAARQEAQATPASACPAWTYLVIGIAAGFALGAAGAWLLLCRCSKASRDS